MLAVLFTEVVIESASLGLRRGDEWTTWFNKNLGSQSSHPRILTWFGSHVNLVIETSTAGRDSIKDSVAVFQTSNGIKSVGFSLSELYWLLGRILVRDCDQPTSRLRKRLGVAFQLKGPKHYFDDFDTERASFRCLQRGIAAVVRNELTIPGQSQSLARIPWPKVSAVLSSKLGGEWTSRNVDSVEGVFCRALECLNMSEGDQGRARPLAGDGFGFPSSAEKTFH